ISFYYPVNHHWIGLVSILSYYQKVTEFFLKKVLLEDDKFLDLQRQRLWDRNDPFFVSLPKHFHLVLVKVDVFLAKIDKFRQSDAGPIKEVEYQLVALTGKVVREQIMVK